MLPGLKIKPMKAKFFVGALLIDQTIKYGMLHFLSVPRSGENTPFFSLGIYRNYGISFSLFASVPRIGLWVGLIGCLCLVGAYLRFKALRTTPGMELLLAGAVGNTLDRIFRGYVVDWLYIGVHVNAADIFLCVGGILLFIRLTGMSPR